MVSDNSWTNSTVFSKVKEEDEVDVEEVDEDDEDDVEEEVEEEEGATLESADPESLANMFSLRHCSVQYKNEKIQIKV